MKAVTPIGEFNCQSFPLVEGNVIVLSDEDEVKLANREVKFSTEEYLEEVPVYDDEGEQVAVEKVKRTRPILIPNDPTPERRRNEALGRIAELKANLARTDYEAIKYAEGEMSEEDYAPFKADRKAWRAEINELEESL